MDDLNTLTLPDLFARLNPPAKLRRWLELVIAEDMADAGDITTLSIIEPRQRAEAKVVAREAGVMAGAGVIDAVMDVSGADVHVVQRTPDGVGINRGEVMLTLSGKLVDILRLERTVLNLLGRLCGVATQTRRYVDAVAGTGAVVCDTRKTTPGMRGLEKYAVRCGGGTLHRIGLFDAALYKDNHIAHLSVEQLPVAIATAAARARQMASLQFVEVEVDTLEQLAALLKMEPGVMDIVLLDNMKPEVLGRAVMMRNELHPRLRLEASGGITLETIGDVASSGVDRISVGALTHSVRCMDIGLDMA